MIRWAELLPQIGIALGIVAVALIVVRQIMGYIRRSNGKPSKVASKRKSTDAPSKPREQADLVPLVSKLIDALTDGNGDPTPMACNPSTVARCGERLDAVEQQQQVHSSSLRKLFAAQARHKRDTDDRLDDILDHLTDGPARRERAPISDDIDEELTG